MWELTDITQDVAPSELSLLDSSQTKRESFVLLSGLYHAFLYQLCLCIPRSTNTMPAFEDRGMTFSEKQNGGTMVFAGRHLKV